MMTAEQWARWSSRGVREGECLIWPGAHTVDKSGVWYGLVRAGDPPKGVLLHRAVWEYFHPDEELPPGRPLRGTPRMVIKHGCNRSLCFEPTHLNLGTQQDNLLERPEDNHWQRGKTHCIRGHSLADAYVYKTKYGIRRNCRTCALLRAAGEI